MMIVALRKVIKRMHYPLEVMLTCGFRRNNDFRLRRYAIGRELAGCDATNKLYPESHLL